MRLREKEHAEVVVVVEPDVVDVEGWPVRAAWTFAIVALFAPKLERSERIDETCASVSVAACAIGARESIDVAIASPVTIAATFAVAFVVTICITIVNDLSAHNNQVEEHKHFQFHTIPQRTVSTSTPWVSWQGFVIKVRPTSRSVSSR